MSGAATLTLSEPSVTEPEEFFAFHGDIPQIDREKPKWHCTGEYLKKNRPDIYQAAVDMLVEPGVSIRSICRTLHVSHNTLASIQEAEAGNLDTRKRHVLKTITRAMRLTAERAEELAPEMSARDAVIALGILSDKAAMIAGEPSMRVEVTAKFDFGAALQQLHAQAVSIAAAKHTEVIEIDTADDGSSAETVHSAPALLTGFGTEISAPKALERAVIP